MTINFKEYDNIIKECRQIAVRKNRDYGTDYLVKYGPKGMLIRISDKIGRLDNLIGKGQNMRVGDEKVNDTLEDIVNYCVYMIMLNNNKLL